VQSVTKYPDVLAENGGDMEQRNQPEVKEHNGVIGKAFVMFRNS